MFIGEVQKVRENGLMIRINISPGREEESGKVTDGSVKLPSQQRHILDGAQAPTQRTTHTRATEETNR